MNKTMFVGISLFLSFFYCSSDVDVQTAEMEPQLTDVLTLELTFGADEVNLKEEFLLAVPRDLAVNNEGDIFVVDEQRLKVFDKYGKEKIIIGRPGIGPGEFDTPSYPIISTNGYLTVEDKKGINIFSPDFKYVKTIKIRDNYKYDSIIQNNALRSLRTSKRAYYDGSTMIFDVSGFSKKENEIFPFYSFLLYEDDKTVSEIAKYNAIETMQIGFIRALLTFRGELLWGLIEEDKIVYIHPGHDISHRNGDFFYYLYILSLANNEKVKITRNYTPITLPDSLKKGYDNSLKQGLEMFSKADEYAYVFKKVKKEINDLLSNLQFYSPLKVLLTDQNYIFAFTYNQNSDGAYFVDVFDATAGEHINSAFFQIIPSVIRNGFAYRLGKNKDGFFVVEKYKIDPSVYVKY